MDHTTDSAATPIDVDTLAGLIETGTVFVLDVRRAVHGEQIYGAIRYDRKKLLDAPKLALPLPKNETPVVLYDEDGTSESLPALRSKLDENGYTGATTLDGGFAAWQAAGGKTEGATIEQVVPLVSTHQAER